MPSHLDLAEAKRRGIPQHFLIGDTVVDELAGASALEARLSESVRARILEVESTARLVRKRLMRATLDVMAVTNRKPERPPPSNADAAASSSPPPPPPPRLLPP
eukprot:6573242-Pyramimonas_sp.AAC.1